jgi:hypothetical protein
VSTLNAYITYVNYGPYVDEVLPSDGDARGGTDIVSVKAFANFFRKFFFRFVLRNVLCTCLYIETFVLVSGGFGRQLASQRQTVLPVHFAPKTHSGERL